MAKLRSAELDTAALGGRNGRFWGSWHGFCGALGVKPQKWWHYPVKLCSCGPSVISVFIYCHRILHIYAAKGLRAHTLAAAERMRALRRLDAKEHRGKVKKGPLSPAGSRVWDGNRLGMTDSKIPPKNPALPLCSCKEGLAPRCLPWGSIVKFGAVAIN